MNLLDKIKIITDTKTTYKKDSEGYIAWIHPYGSRDLFSSRLDIIFTRYGKGGRPRIEGLTVYANPLDIDTELIPMMQYAGINQEDRDEFLSDYMDSRMTRGQVVIQRIGTNSLTNLSEFKEFDFLVMASLVAWPLHSIIGRVDERAPQISNQAFNFFRDDFRCAKEVDSGDMSYLIDQVFLQDPRRLPNLIHMAYELDYKYLKKPGARIHTLLAKVADAQFRKDTIAKIREMSIVGMGTYRVAHDKRLASAYEVRGTIAGMVSRFLTSKRKNTNLKSAVEKWTKYVPSDDGFDVVRMDRDINPSVPEQAGGHVEVRAKRGYFEWRENPVISSDPNGTVTTTVTLHEPPNPPPGYVGYVPNSDRPVDPAPPQPELARSYYVVHRRIISGQFPSDIEALQHLNEVLANTDIEHPNYDVGQFLHNYISYRGQFCASSFCTRDGLASITYIINGRESGYANALVDLGRDRELAGASYLQEVEIIPTPEQTIRQINSLSPDGRIYTENDLTVRMAVDITGTTRTCTTRDGAVQIVYKRDRLQEAPVDAPVAVQHANNSLPRSVRVVMCDAAPDNVAQVRRDLNTLNGQSNFYDYSDDEIVFVESGRMPTDLDMLKITYKSRDDRATVEYRIRRLNSTQEVPNTPNSSGENNV